MIYALADPVTGSVFYIGHSGNLKRRKADHLSGSDKVTGRRVRELWGGGDAPAVIWLEERASKVSALFAEDFWIDLFFSRGAYLLNKAPARDRGWHARKREQEKQGSKKNESVKRIGVPWSAQEESFVSGAKTMGLREDEIADLVGRSVRAVTMRLEKMGKGKK